MFFDGLTNKMLGKIKIAAEELSDEGMKGAVIQWVTSGSPSAKVLKQMMIWYRNNGLKSDKSMNIFRGLGFTKDDYLDNMGILLEGKSLDLEGNIFTSWSVDPKIGVRFAGGDGMVLSNKISVRDSYFDINKVLNYLMIKEYLDKYSVECEIVTNSIPCKGCKLADIEGFRLRGDMLYEILDLFESNKYIISAKPLKGREDFYFIISNNEVSFLSEFNFTKNFKLKQDTECS